MYEGRGWGLMGAHAKGNNHDSLGVAFMGNFNSKFTHLLYLFILTMSLLSFVIVQMQHYVEICDTASFS